jgi:hypothetical protein
MALKIPPPPQLTGPEWQSFNRWLLEVTSILTNQGGIDPSEVAGLPELIVQVGTNTTDITALESGQGGQAADILTLQGDTVILFDNIATINGQLTSLGARAQVYHGVADPAPGFGDVDDWFANTAGAAGHRIFVKTGAATWTAFPF